MCKFLFFRCVNSVLGLYSHPFEIRMYMRIMIVRLVRRKLYAWYNAYRKKVNAKVRNYNLRDLDKETNMKVLNLFMSGWQLAPLRK